MLTYIFSGDFSELPRHLYNIVLKCFFHGKFEFQEQEVVTWWQIRGIRRILKHTNLFFYQKFLNTDGVLHRSLLLRNRKNCVFRSHEKRRCWFVFTILKVLYFGNSFHRVKMSLPNIIWVLFCVCGRESFEWGPNIQSREVGFCTILQVRRCSRIFGEKISLYASHLLYYSDLSSCDYFLFLKFKFAMKETFYDDVTQVTRGDSEKSPKKIYVSIGWTCPAI